MPCNARHSGSPLFLDAADRLPFPSKLPMGVIDCGYLLRLPGEVRNAIYELVVRSDSPIDLISLPWPSECFFNSHDNCTYPAITHGTGQVADEALAVFFAVNHFHAKVFWLPTDDHQRLPVEQEKRPMSGIRGLGLAFRRIGARNCHAISRLQIEWLVTVGNEANLTAMTAWARLWAVVGDEVPYLPKMAMMTHKFRTPDGFGSTYDDVADPLAGFFSSWGFISGYLVEGFDQGTAARAVELREQLVILGTAFGLAEASGVLDSGSIEDWIVLWVMGHRPGGSKELKEYIKKEWNNVSLTGRLDQELRSRIYGLALGRSPSQPPAAIPLELPYGPFESFVNSLPPLLHLYGGMATEAMGKYFRHNTFATSLEFTKLNIKRLKDLAEEIRLLWCTSITTTPLELHVEWRWPKTLTVKDLSAFVKLTHYSSSMESYMKITRTPATTTMTRILATILTTLEQVARKEGRNLGSPRRARLCGQRADKVFRDHPKIRKAWYRDCVLDWIVGEYDCDEHGEVRELCRDLFRHDLDTREPDGKHEEKYDTLITESRRKVTNAMWPIQPDWDEFFDGILSEDVPQPLPDQQDGEEESSSTAGPENHEADLAPAIDEPALDEIIPENEDIAEQASPREDDPLITEATDDISANEPTDDGIPVAAVAPSASHNSTFIDAAWPAGALMRHPAWNWDTYPYERD
ncbi:hypothetical protein LTR97_000531 [Elasticomyces elasticus]|uniref:Uncharacterized protein n=1 Tax=Elasticomyces elasticus TaxID=574655 RepID=A0AAN7VXI2_9PEZI|nr:hypothetical protein LTR97_000531 [Elasticomyces elasticus]